METIELLTEKALRLQPVERIRLAEAILYSLDKPDTDTDRIWISESESRYEAYKRGEIDAVDWDTIKKRYSH
ncbi:addiction module protein [Desulfococcaceae bacterium HSG8]|nr:addiction module protein [Desulfococcaceae bacterium HSG8]